MVRTKESDLIMPALRILADTNNPQVGVSVADLRRKLRERIHPTPEDLMKLKGRNDDKLSQVLRNLISHRTLERKGLAIYYRHLATNEGFYRLTELGRKSLEPQPNHRYI